MPAPHNPFKAAINNGETVIGCWLSLGDPLATEIAGTAGFDWLLIDGEHTPYDISRMRMQLMALQASDSHAAVRVPSSETWIIKQVLDAGAQTVLVPMVESAAQARHLVGDVRYPPTGHRGVGYSGARCSRFGAITDYGQTADDQICLLVQVENRAGIANLDEILAVDGIDGVFIGPADLSADMGHMGDLTHPEVQATIRDAFQRIEAAGKAPGVLATTPEMTQDCLDWGARFVATGIDLLILARQLRSLAATWKGKVAR
ncbi:HpcH/HpaI aldolase/citrate lyase family protein [uncultured Tateyamaria sp.]|uniref:HpcH/HpaI aldolase family protein n=1 Tax=uncultured Tateyamaria sp. TaxID=455651 RepID=UPI00261C736B|nr:HpcH/HpaI aldolase/citrate lyase family protein [uncultured Tateyamaria sp.]